MQCPLGRIVFLILSAGVCSAEQAEKPLCNAQTLGRFWPDEANWDREAAKRAGRCGELQICTRGVWMHRWQPLTVHVTQLGKGHKRSIPGCATTNTSIHAVAAARSPNQPAK